MIDHLNPCPCGGVAVFERRGTARVSSIVVCTECGLRLESNESDWNSGQSWNALFPVPAVPTALIDGKSSELLPCPFCQGQPRRDRTLRDGCEDGEPDAWAYFVRCISCAAQGGWAKTPGNADRHWNLRAWFRVSDIRVVCAIAAWQTRGDVHPLTCGKNSAHRLLVPFLSGTVLRLRCLDCDWVQPIPPLFGSALEEADDSATG